LLPDAFGERLRDEPPEDVGAAAGQEADEDADGFRGVRLRERGGGSEREQDCSQKNSSCGGVIGICLRRPDHKCIRT
jgi:hypothetical protein